MRIHHVVIVTAAVLLPVLAQTPKSNPAADWPMYNRDLAGTRYSPLTQISTSNVTDLKLACTGPDRPASTRAAPRRAVLHTGRARPQRRQDSCSQQASN